MYSVSPRYSMLFEKEDLNSLMYYLDFFEDDSVVKKIMDYSSLVEENGKQYVRVKFFGDELRTIVFMLLALLPSKCEDDVFDRLSQAIHDRQQKYVEEREREAQFLKDGIKRELLNNPTITGVELAARLNVSKDKIYAMWNAVKSEIAVQFGGGSPS